MANAKVNIQTINIDINKDKKSMLIFNKKQYYFVSSLENIEFDGFLKVYDNTTNDEENDEPVKGKLEIKEKDIINMNKLKTSEEYTKLPLRYNEAGLIKFLEKNGIGRPATFASNVNHVIENKYVEIKNIDGVKKDSQTLELSDKYKLKELKKEIIFGKESKKLVPTEMGKQIVDFLLKNFGPIMEIKFTAEFETYLDKIAKGTAKIYNVLSQYYNIFNPMCEALIKEIKTNPNATDELLGIDPDTQLEIYKGTGIHGPYVKRLIEKDSKKFKYCSIDELKDITLEKAIELLKYPIVLGLVGKAELTLHNGNNGYYVKFNDKNYSIKDKKTEEITLEYAKTLIESGDKYAIKSFTIKNKVINVKNGEFGPFLQVITGKTKSNVKIPNSYDFQNLTEEQILKILENQDKSFKIKDKIINVKNGPHGPYLQIINGDKKSNISIPKSYDHTKLTVEQALEIIAEKNGTIKK